MKIYGAFAGIGGFEVGLAKAGHSAIGFCEVLPAAQAVLHSKFSDVRIDPDVVELTRLPFGTDVLCAGFPCQDLSQAGQTRGLAGDRSGLIHQIFRILKTHDVPWVVLENVPFMLQLQGGAAIRDVVAHLESLDYRWAYRVVDTYSFGLPQRRERVYLVASRDGDPADVVLADDNPLVRPNTAIGEIAHGFYWTEGRGGLGWAPDAVPTLKNGSTIGIPSPPAILLPTGELVKPDLLDVERLQGFDADWTAAAETVARKSSRWGLVGSAVSTPVAEWIGKRLANPGHYDTGRDRDYPIAGKMPRAARFDGHRRVAVEISADPLGIRPQHLHEFLRFPTASLSEKATAGFRSRTRVATLRFADGFIEAVDRHLARVREISGTPPLL